MASRLGSALPFSVAAEDPIDVPLRKHGARLWKRTIPGLAGGISCLVLITVAFRSYLPGAPTSAIVHASQESIQTALDRLQQLGMEHTGSLAVPPHRLDAKWSNHLLGATSQRVLSNHAQAALKKAIQDKMRYARAHPARNCEGYHPGTPEFDSYESTDGSTLANAPGHLSATLTGSGVYIESTADWWTVKYAPRKICSMATCFNTMRPACRAPGPLRTFWYEPELHIDIWGREELKKSTFPDIDEWPLADWYTRVNRPEDACLFVVTAAVRRVNPSAFKQRKKYLWSDERLADFKWSDLEYWTAVDGVPGRNHLIMATTSDVEDDASGIKKPFGPTGDAILSMMAFWKDTFNPNFDIVIPQGLWTRFMNASVTSELPWKIPWHNQDRPYLITFRGNVGRNGGPTYGYQIRKIAAEVAHNPEEGIIIDTVYERRKYPGQFSLRYPWWDKWSVPEKCYSPASDVGFDQLMYKTLYGYAAAGNGPYTMRSLEVIAGRAVLVTTEDMVLPWEHDLPWDDCVIRVSRSELFALGEVLNAIAPRGSEAYDARLQACARIWHTVYAGPLKMSSKGSLQTQWKKQAHFMFWDALTHRVKGERLTTWQTSLDPQSMFP